MQQQQIKAGPQGVPGPRGIADPAGKNGKDGKSAQPITVPATSGLASTRTVQMTVLEARAYCTDLAAKAWPESDDADPTMDALTDAYSSSQRENAFKDCMSDEGHPQP
ncbi:hypothetical protein ACFU98_38395 [Streptomyces sp. NPDC057575]|uniref:hypothetical protein n=1 Tax=unclassified Streptomyces TaxID=2593676 RepID=UPI0036AEBEBF